MNYDALIKRAEKVIKSAKDKITGKTIHRVDIDTDISNKHGLVIIIHPDYVKLTKEHTQTSEQTESKQGTQGLYG